MEGEKRELPEASIRLLMDAYSQKIVQGDLPQPLYRKKKSSAVKR
jgi:hypothetical protein